MTGPYELELYSCEFLDSRIFFYWVSKTIKTIFAWFVLFWKLQKKKHNIKHIQNWRPASKFLDPTVVAGSKPFYYIDKSVLVEKKPLVKFIRNYIRDSSSVFSISSLVRISMTSFPALILLFVQKYSCLHNKKKITRWIEDMNFIFSRQKNNILRTSAASE